MQFGPKMRFFKFNQNLTRDVFLIFCLKLQRHKVFQCLAFKFFWAKRGSEWAQNEVFVRMIEVFLIFYMREITVV